MGRGDEKDLTKLWVGGKESGEENGAKKLVKRIFSWEKILFFFFSETEKATNKQNIGLAFIKFLGKSTRTSWCFCWVVLYL